MGWLCDQMVKAGGIAIADFICPMPEARAVFLEGDDAFIVWVDRIKQGAFEDTIKMFVPSERCNLRVSPEGTVGYWRERVRLVGRFKSSTSKRRLSDMIGRPLFRHIFKV